MNNELKHYGVLGMKWGVRRGNTKRAYEKASKKAAKLDKRIREDEEYMNKKIAKADKKVGSRFASDKAQTRAVAKAREATSEYRKTVQKGRKWYEAMEKTFKDTDIKLSSEQVQNGRKYAQTLRMYSMARY